MQTPAELLSLQSFVDYVCISARGSDTKGIAALDICFHRHSYMFSMAKQFNRVSIVTCSVTYMA